MTKVNYTNQKEDAWFKWQGQKPPERIPHLTDEEREQLMAENLNNHKCVWYQKGNFAICDVAEFEHGKNIGVKQMIDEAETARQGKLVLRPRGPLLREQKESA